MFDFLLENFLKCVYIMNVLFKGCLIIFLKKINYTIVGPYLIVLTWSLMIYTIVILLGKYDLLDEFFSHP